MSKVITFSRYFPKGHPRAGEPTYFVGKILISLNNQDWDIVHDKNNPEKSLFELLPIDLTYPMRNPNPKFHTIRAGNRWKVGDKFSPRVWSGKPYNSPQIIIAPDIEIKKVFQFTISGGEFWINDNIYDGMNIDFLEQIAANDGLTRCDLLDWFKYPKPFQGQIICWNESINY